MSTQNQIKKICDPTLALFEVKKYINDKKRILYITAQNLQSFANNFNTIYPDKKYLLYPALDTIPYDTVLPSRLLTTIRQYALLAIVNNTEESEFIVASGKAILNFVPSDQYLAEHSLYLSKDMTYHYQDIINTLISYGYERVAVAENPGDFAIHGSIIDIVISNASNQSDNIYGIRIDFFGNTIVDIRIFDVISQKTVKKIKDCTIISINYQDILINSQEQVAALIPSDTIICIEDQIWPEIDQYYTKINSYYQQRIRENNLLPIKTPEELYCTKNALLHQINKHQNILFSQWGTSNAGHQIVSDLQKQANLYNQEVFDFLKNYGIKHNKKVIIGCHNQASKERIIKMLKHHDIKIMDVRSWDEIKFGQNLDTIDVINFISTINFMTNQYIFFTGERILSKNFSKATQVKNINKRFFCEAQHLKPGDLIVHIDHGIGRFISIEVMQIDNILRDMIKIEYAGEDFLYVPVENFDLLTQYQDIEKTQLDRLGSANWQHKKAKVKNRIKIAAQELIKIAAERQTKKAIILHPIKELYDQFIEKFPYIETDDQLQTEFSILEDMESGNPMDRLVCGDVGFGKTEVAMRASACTVFAESHSAQVAIIVPTTLLARQHYVNFCDRFKDMPVTIAQLSKFTSRQDMVKNKKALKEGKIDIIIGTHALLSKDVEFKNLGLVVIDEEQHFGVSQKEALKKIKNEAHILTLSATPIPRTLNMALLGIKQMSLLTIPPIDRLPIHTTILSYKDPIHIRELVLNELLRDGRIFIVTPYISEMDELEQFINMIVPEVKIGRAHGQLTSSQLDLIMNDFYDGKFHILLSTAIVESGLDIPTANTVIINNADKFGLTQLHQIRGRVGRGKLQAYACLITSNRITSYAKRRLDIFAMNDSLGAGFNIAAGDMDIRGAGNLLGSEQSGNMNEVGIELYQDMLQDAVINAMQQDNLINQEWSPVLELGFSSHIPAEYISDSGIRLNLYKRLANIVDYTSLKELMLEIEDRFGSPIPESLTQLITVINVKNLAKKHYVKKIERSSKGVTLSLHTDLKIDPNKMLDLVGKYNGIIRMDMRLFFNKQWNDDKQFIDFITTLLSEII